MFGPGPKSVLLHIPHSSLVVPDDVRAGLAIEGQELDLEVLRMTDRFTDDLFHLETADRLVFPVSRLVVDPGRFVDDDREPMAGRGMGAVYTRTSDGALLRQAGERQELLDRYYVPHHARLNEWAGRALDAHGRCLVIDCHSYPSAPLPCDQDQALPRPMFCVGTDSFHTPPSLVDFVVGGLMELAGELPSGANGKDVVLVDRPYSGTMVPSQFHGSDPRVASIMIEINRSLYMDESTGAAREDYSDFRRLFAELLKSISEAWRQGLPA